MRFPFFSSEKSLRASSNMMQQQFKKKHDATAAFSRK
jgi:hypothetical protein